MAKKKKDPEEPAPDVSSADESPDEPQSSEVRKRKKIDGKKGKEASPKEEYIEMADDPQDVEVKGGGKTVPKMLTTREIGKRFLDREAYLKLCLREMMIYIVFLTIVGILAGGQHSQSEYYLSRVMVKLFVETKFRTWTTSEIINYSDINTLEQVWEYFNHFLFSTYWSFWYSHHDKVAPTKPEYDMIFYENKLMGRPRIRQLRVRSDSCTVPEDFKLMFSSCYAEYSSSSESKDKFGPDGAGPETAWNYQSQSEEGSLTISGEISSYFGGGYYIDMSNAQNLDEVNTTIRKLFEDLWIDRGSRAIILQFTTYNPNENLFFTMQLLMELPPTGGVLPSYKVHVHTFLMRDIWDYVLLVLFVIFVIFVIVYTFIEVVEIFYFKWHYFDYFWNVCDFTILALSYVTIGFFIYQFLLISSETTRLIQEKIDEVYTPYDTVNNARETYITLLAILFFFAAIKLLKYMNFNHSMYQMQMTLSKATKDIACFSIIFFIVFITFAQLGHLLFGSQVRDFRSFIHSVFALLRTAVGDFDYHKIENVNHFLGPVYFFAYIFFIYFILVNMFLAIIIDTYSEVRTSIRDQSKELQISDIVCGWIRKMFICCGCRKMAEKHDQPLASGGGSSAYQDIQNLLRRCGFTEMEIDLFFAKFDIPKDRPITQEEMRSKLLTNFNIQPDAAQKGATEGPERDEVGEKLMARIRVLEDNITDVNYKIDLIDNKIDAIQQIRARRRTMADKDKDSKK